MTSFLPSLKKCMRDIVIVMLLFVSLQGRAQELNAIVTINVGPKIQTTDRNVFRDMKNALQQFLNTRKWTNDAFQPHEKINCSLLININEMPSIASVHRFRFNLQDPFTIPITPVFC